MTNERIVDLMSRPLVVALKVVAVVLMIPCAPFVGLCVLLVDWSERLENRSGYRKWA